jgi:hypothetical protein
MAYGKGEAQEKHDKFTWQSGVWGFHDKHRVIYVNDEERHVYYGV